MSWLSTLRPETAWVLPAVAALVVGLACAAMNHLLQSRKAELRAETEQESLALKRAMIERGMSAAEIEQVLLAGRPSGEVEKAQE